MDKRVTGVTVIVVGLLAVLVLGGLQGRMTAGVGQHGPSVRTGDCAQLTPRPGPGDVSDIRRFPVSVASWADCAEAGSGTVIGGTVRPTLPETETPVGYTNLMSECDATLRSYLVDLLGRDYSWDVTGSHLTFQPVSTVRGYPARAAAEQAPAVCVLGRPQTGGVVEPVVVDAARPGDGIGVCAPSWDDRQFLACTRPHQVEVMASVTDRRVRMGVNLRAQDGCAAFLALATGRSDPTFGGQLRVLMDPVPADGSAVVSCGLGVVDPNRQLNGSLIGIEDRALPLV